MSFTLAATSLSFNSVINNVNAEEEDYTYTIVQQLSDDKQSVSVEINVELKEDYEIVNVQLNNEVKETKEAVFILESNGEYIAEISYKKIGDDEIITKALEKITINEIEDKIFNETEESALDSKRIEAIQPEAAVLDFLGIQKYEDTENLFAFSVYKKTDVEADDNFYFYGIIDKIRGWFVLNTDNRWELIADDEAVATVMNRNNWRDTADYSANIQINSWGIYDASDIELSASNQASSSSGYKLKFNWSLTVPAGGVLHANDTIVIPVPQGGPKVLWTAQNGAYENFYQGTILMGKWRFQNNSIEIIFGANAEGHATITGIEFTSGANALTPNYSSAADFVENVSFNGQTKPVGYLGTPLLTGDFPNLLKGSGGASNSVISWFTTVNYSQIQNSSKTQGLAVVPLGTKAVVRNNCYFEDHFSADAKFAEGTGVFYATMAIPASLSSTANAAINASYAMDITSKFTRRNDENSFPTYAAFKASLNPFEWGIYNNADGTQTAVVFYGNIGNNGMTYDSLESNWIQNAVNYAVNNFYPDTPANRNILTNWFTDVYGNGNVLNGNVVGYNFHFGTVYNKVISDTNKSNTMSYSYDGLTENSTGTGTLQGILGNVIVNAYAARAYKIDTDTLAIVQNATIKLQQSTDGGISWHDYGVPQQTNNNGFVEFTGLGVAKYRFVETAAAPSYDLNASPGYDSGAGGVVSNEFDVLSGETEGHKVLLENKKTGYKVIYDWGTDFPSDQTIPTDNNSYATMALAEAAVDTTYFPSYISTAPKNGVNGTWYFSGWDGGTWTGNTIKFVGSWHFVASLTIPTNVHVVKEFDLINGQQPPTNKTFVFTITPSAGSPAVSAPTSVSVNGAGTSPKFGNITFAQAGTFTYKVKETAGSDAGYTYDNTEWTVTYKISDINGVLTLDAGYPKYNDGTSNKTDIVFKNIYVPQSLTQTGITVDKSFDLVNGQQPPTNKTFTFTIVPSTGSPAVAAPTSVTVSGAGTSSNFGNITFNKAGVFTYKVKEVIGSDAGYTYDNTEWTITYKISDVNGTLSLDSGYPKYNNGTSDEAVVIFKNIYVPTPINVKIPLEKKINGDASTHSFDFKLEAVSTNVVGMIAQTMPMPAGSISGVFNGSYQKGIHELGMIKFSREGVYNYKLSEITGTILGMTYDNTYYDIEITVIDNNGVLETSKKVTKYSSLGVPLVTNNFGMGINISGIEFINNYLKPHVPVAPKENKSQPGRTCQDDGYPNGYYWDDNKQMCVYKGYKVPHTGNDSNPLGWMIIIGLCGGMILYLNLKRRKK